MFIRPWLDALKSRWLPGNTRRVKRIEPAAPLNKKVESLEDRALLAFDIITAIPNQGTFLDPNAAPVTLNEAPREMVLRFTPGETIDPLTLGAITVVRAGLDGNFDNPATITVESTDDQSVPLGHIGIGDNPNEVIIRFASTLPDDKYQIRIRGTGPTPLRSLDNPATVANDPEVFNNGVDRSVAFELDLGAQVEAVVPQPVIRTQRFSVTDPARVADGDLITVQAGPYTFVFEMNLVGDLTTGPGHVAIDYAAGDTAAQIAGKIATAINNPVNTLSILTASATGETVSVAGTAFEPKVTFTSFNFDAYARTLLSVADAPNLADGDTFTLTSGLGTTRFEFNKAPNNLTAPGNVRINFNNGASNAQIATLIAAAINALPANSPTTQIRATVVGGDKVAITTLGSLGTPAVSTTTAVANVFTQNFGALSQITDTVVVYFNQDQLDEALAEDPTFYRIINTTTNEVSLPQTVTYRYNAANGLNAAVLKFASSIAGATYRIEIGTSSEPNNAVSQAVNVGTVFSSKDYQTSDYLGDGNATSSNAADVDFYRFRIQPLAPAVTGTATITLTPGANLNGVVTVYAADGTTVVGTMDAGAAGVAEVLTLPGLAGEYFVRVSSTAGTGSYTLKIESDQAATTNNNVPNTGDDNSSFATSTDLGVLGADGVFLASQIQSQGAFVVMPDLPGGSNEPGHRELPSGAYTGFSAPEVGHGTGQTGNPSAPGPLATGTYSFPTTYGNNLLNQITDEQKEIIRTIFALYSSQVGIQFHEVAAGGMGIVVGDIRVNAPSLPADAAGGISGSPLIINAIFYANENEFGGGFTTTALHEIGHNLGLGHSYDVPSVQGGGGSTGLPIESVFTRDNDLIHLLRVFPNKGSDIDLYKFNVPADGTISAEVLAERLGPANFFDSYLTLYKEDGAGKREVVARNDDFYSKDSGMEIAVTPGTYYLGVTSKGNDNYDPSISNSGFGGRSEGAYQLQLDFTPTPLAANGLADTTGNLIDGDHDGLAGGVYTGWFNAGPTIIVDKLAPAGGNGTVGAPFQFIDDALAVSAPGSIVRIVGNGGADGDVGTTSDNVPYQVGTDFGAGAPLADGQTFQVPKGVTVVIEAGSLIKLRGQNVDVGSSSSGIDRSNGALQVLGTPVNNVFFTSWRDDAKGSVDDGVNGNPAGSDWGGIVFRQDSDSAVGDVFLNQVNHATIQYGGGQVAVDGAQPAAFSPIHLVTSRPTLTNNLIQNNSNSAISANPDSFQADDGRIGPDIHGNLVTNNSTNGLFVRVQTAFGSSFELLNVIARFDDTDITHVITQNLILNGKPAGALSNEVSARLMIDPGTVVKLAGARIETGVGSSNLIAEGTPENPIRFTSLQDDRFGNGGTFDAKGDGNTTPTAGNWSGIFAAQTSTVSLDYVSITYAGGSSEISGNSDNFNPIEALQANLRVSNSLFEENAGGAAGTTRGGRGTNDSSTIFVRGAQPIIVDNVFRDNTGNVISINANSFQDVIKTDAGRSTGLANAYTQFNDNYGPLVRLNTYENNSTNGMNIRSEELTIESVWDDTDIAHVVRGAIASGEFHTYGGLRLQSSATGSLVVKLQGANAGFIATGDPLEITDRIGGTVQVVGQPGFPVILTSLADDTISTGFLPNGLPLFDTNNNGASVGSPGDWNSLSFDQYSNDRNVAIVMEREDSITQGNDENGTVGNPQSLGNLAPNQNNGDENRRLGFEVQGFISPDSPGDVDVYSFTADPGTEVWIDTDFTSQRLDVMVELLNSAGTVLARSTNSIAEQADPATWLSTYAGTLAGTVGNSNLNTLTKDPTLGVDFYTSNFHDAGFRAVLPGTGTDPITYFVRVRSQPTAGQEANPAAVTGGLTSGKYQLQVRLKQVDEIPGSTVSYADIRYATNGVVLTGLPAHSPLMGEMAEGTGDNNAPDGSQALGPLLQQDRNTFSVSGSLQSDTDVDFFSFTVDYSQVQVIIPGPKFFPTTFDIDWADGLTRPDTVIAVYNSDRDLIYIGRESDIGDDQPGLGQGQDLDDFSRGSLGKLDPFLGTVNLPAGVNGLSETGGSGVPSPSPAAGLTTYYVAVFSNGQLPTALSASFTGGASAAVQQVRLEPINSIKRVVEDHIGFTGYTSQDNTISPTTGPLFNYTDSISLQANIRPFTLSDVNLFVTTSGSLFVVDPFNGSTEIDYANYGGSNSYNDLDMRSDGRLASIRSSGASNNGQFGYLSIDQTNPESGATFNTDGIANTTTNQLYQENNVSPDALAFRRSGAGAYDRLYYAIANSDNYTQSTNTPPPTHALDPNGAGVSKLYRASVDTGSAGFSQNNLGAVGNIRDAAGQISTLTTGMQYFGGTLWGVSAAAQFYRINDGNSVNTANGNPDGDITDANQILPQNLVFGTIFDLSLRTGGAGLAGLADAPQNVESGAYADLLFAITTDGRLLAIDPTNPTAQQLIFDSDGDNIADADTLDLGINGVTGLGFSPVDYNLWHPTQRRSADAGHGINTTSGTQANPSVDNSRTPTGVDVSATFGTETMDSNEGVGGASFYFGIEQFNSGAAGNYFQYDSGGQYGVFSSNSQQDLTTNTAYQNNYNAPGGASGSLVTNSFSLEGYTSTDKPTLYFNYWLQTEGANGKSANSMRDSARVYVSTDNGQTWDLAATNNSTPSADMDPDAELPSYLSASKSSSSKPNQHVQELYETASWRQARVDLADYVGATQIKLRFDFSTSGRSGTVADPNNPGQRMVSSDTSNPTYQDDEGGSFGMTPGSSETNSPPIAANNTSEGFYIDDIIVGFAGRGEMVTGSAGVAATTTAVPVDRDPNRIRPLLSGDYQLEIRRGEQYSVLVDPPSPAGLVTVNPVLDINDRQTNGQTVRVGNTVQDGNTVTVYDGLITRTFEFNSVGGVTAPNVSVTIGGTQGANAAALANAINTAFAGRNTVIAVAVSSATNSDRVDIYGAVSVTGVGTLPPITNLGSESEVGAFGWGNDYPLSFPAVANTLGAFTAGTDGYYTLAGQIGNSQIAGNPDSDFFAVNMVLGQTLTVDLTAAPAGSNYALIVTDSSVNPLAQAFNNILTFTATSNGTFYLGVFGDDGDPLTLPINTAFNAPPDPAASAGNDVFTYTLDMTLQSAGATLPTALTVESYVRQGDDNLERQQGQVIIENNTILYSGNDGIYVDDEDRFGLLPHPGAVRNSPVNNTQRLATGIYLQNNVIARSQANGIEIAGDPNVAVGAGIVPFVKVVNNTIYGSEVPSGVGIRVANNAGPTLMNNAFVNLTTGITVDASSRPTTEIEANLFQGNTVDSNWNIGVNALAGTDTAGLPMFVNAANNNFYPASGSPLVDSARNTFNDRVAYSAVTSQFGIDPSPILAPLFDRFNQLRVDDSNQPGPVNQPGIGSNPFQDRGAIERADIFGGLVIPFDPLDNDGAGVDYDADTTEIWIDSDNATTPFTILTQLKLQLIDQGIGIDDDSVDVDGADFLLIENGVPLTQGLDYFFTYNRNTNECIFTSVSTFKLDARYQIIVKAAGITDFAGNVLQNNQTGPVSPANPLVTDPGFTDSLLYFTYIVTDGENDAPTTFGPTTAVTDEEVSITFSAANGNAITVGDSDAFLAPDGDPNTGAQGGRIRVTVYVPDGQGTLVAGDPANLLANGGTASGTGSASDPYILEGRIDDINTALDGLIYTPDPDFPVGPSPVDVPLTIQTEDLGKFGPPAPGTSDPQTSTNIVMVTVNPINDPPTLSPIDTAANAAALTVLEDSGVPTPHTVNFSGISAGGGETQTLQVTVTSNNQVLVPNANITPVYTSANAAGSFTWFAAANRFGTATLTVTVTDAGFDNTFGTGDDNSTSRAVTVNVTGVNDAPTIGTITPNSATVVEDSTPITVNLSGITAGPFETQTLSVTATSSNTALIANPVITNYNPGAGTATLTYQPVANMNGGPVTITVTVNDGGGTANGGVETASQSFVVNVTPVNDPPSLNAIAAVQVMEDPAISPVQVPLTGIGPGPADEAAQALTFSASSSNQGLIPDGNITFTYTNGNTTGTLNFVPVANAFGTANITVTLQDDGGGTNTVTRTFAVTVASVNDRPTLTIIPDPAAINEDAAEQTVNLQGITPGPANEAGQGLTVTAVSSNTAVIPNPTIVNFNQTTGTAELKYTPVPNASGTVTITVTVKDDGGTANGGVDELILTFNVVINGVNDLPTLNAIPNPAAILEDAATQTVNLAGITAGPLEAQTLAVTATSSNVTLIPNGNILVAYFSANPTGMVSYTPALNQNGTATITVQVRDAGLNGILGDGDDAVTTQSFDVTVTPVNDAPTMDVISDVTLLEDAPLQTVNLTGLTAGPNESQTLAITAVSDNPSLIPNPTVNYASPAGTGSLTFTPVPNAFGVATITVTMTDNGGTANGGSNVVIRTFKVTVTPVGDTPVDVVLGNAAVFENQPVGTLVGSFATLDVDTGDTFTYTLVSGENSSGNSAFAIVNNELRTAQILDFETQSSYSVRVRTTDSYGLILEKVFTIQVLNLNDAPTLNVISDVVMNEDAAPLTVNLSGISAGFGENQSLTIQVSSSNTALIANPIPVTYTSPNATGSLRLTPIANANGMTTITVTVLDNGGTANGGVNSFTRTFTVTVNAVNDAPTDITLTNDTISENTVGVVGTLSSLDPDAGNTFTYSLVNGTGSGDNGKFNIVNDQLFATGPIDFDTQPNYSLRVRTTDQGGLSIDKVLVIHATNINEAAIGVATTPNPISGIPNSIPENQPVGAIVGALVALDPDASDVSSFAIVDGVGGDDNALFQIVGGNLIANASFDFETKNSYTIRFRVIDAAGLQFEGPLVISITNANETPSNLALSNSTVSEDVALNTVVGTLSAVDIDAADTFTFSLVDGTGSTDNTRFSINGNQLVVATPLNFEEKPGHFYTVRVRGTDAGGLVFEKVFNITVTDVNENPTALTTNFTTVDENLPAGTVVGNFAAEDEDEGETFTYALVGGIGSEDNDSFTIVGNQLVTTTLFDFEAKPTYTARVRVTDSAGHALERVITIGIKDTSDPPVLTIADSQLSTQGKKPVSLDTAAAIFDNDSPTFNGGRITVEIVSGEQTGDTLSIRKEKGKNGLRLKTARGKSVLRLGKDDIATIRGGKNGVRLELQLGSGVGQAVVERILRNITFRGKPFAATRLIAVQVFDDKGLGSNIETREVKVN